MEKAKTITLEVGDTVFIFNYDYSLGMRETYQKATVTRVTKTKAIISNEMYKDLKIQRQCTENSYFSVADSRYESYSICGCYPYTEARETKCQFDIVMNQIKKEVAKLTVKIIKVQKKQDMIDRSKILSLLNEINEILDTTK